MIEGLEVIDQATKWSATGWSIVGGVVFALVGLFFVCTGFGAISWNEPGEAILIFLIAAACIFGSVMLFFEYAHRYQYVEYKVAIGNEVRKNAFDSEYDVIRQDGKIYTVRERDSYK